MSKNNWFYSIIISLATSLITVVVLILFMKSPIRHFKPEYLSISFIGLFIISIFSIGVLKTQQDSYMGSLIFGVVTSLFFAIFFVISLAIRLLFVGKIDQFSWERTGVISVVIFGFMSLVSCIIPFITRKKWISKKNIPD